MVVTNDVTLPSFDELSMDEVNLSAATLLTAAPYVGKMCEGVNNEFILCRQELNDPRPCLLVGKQVTACAMEVFRRIKDECLEEFKQYQNCVDKSSGNFAYRHCRKTQAVFDNCMQDKLCVERPDFGYFCRGRIHTSPRKAPPPPPCPCRSEVPDATPSLPDDHPRIPPRFNGRSYFMYEWYAYVCICNYWRHF